MSLRLGTLPGSDVRIVSDEAVAAIRRHVPSTTVVSVPGATHYTVLLGDAGARAVARVLTEVP
jgi:hypothetical protein